MAIKYGFFNSSGEDRRIYQAADFARRFGLYFSDGIFRNDGDAMKVSPGLGMQVLVGTGAGHLKGYYAETTTGETLVISNPGATLRKDRIVLKLDLSTAARNVTLYVKTGGTNPPELTRTSSVWEISLATINVRVGTNTILASDIVDERYDNTVCGWVSSPPLKFEDDTFIYKCNGSNDTSALTQIINDFFNFGTAMSMKLMIIGTLGVDTPESGKYYVIDINAENLRSARCQVDFSGCNTPKIGNNSFTFLNIMGSGPKMTISGLKIVSEYGGIVLRQNANGNIIENCDITAKKIMADSTGSSVTAYALYGAYNNTFNNCIGFGYMHNTKTTVGQVDANGHGLGVFGSLGANFFNNCIFKGEAYAIHTTTSGAAMGYGKGAVLSTGSNDGSFGEDRFNNCYFSGTGYGKNVDTNVTWESPTGVCGLEFGANTANRKYRCAFNNCIIKGDGTPPVQTADYWAPGIGIQQAGSTGMIEASFINCEISGTGKSGYGYGVRLEPVYNNLPPTNKHNYTFMSCRIIGKDYGVQVGDHSLGPTTQFIRLLNCFIKGDTQSVRHITGINTAGTFTVRWEIMGNIFNKSNIIVDGSTAITEKTASTNIYFPAFANRFGIDLTQL